jgi:hypothetical protein
MLFSFAGGSVLEICFFSSKIQDLVDDLISLHLFVQVARFNIGSV